MRAVFTPKCSVRFVLVCDLGAKVVELYVFGGLFWRLNYRYWESSKWLEKPLKTDAQKSLKKSFSEMTLFGHTTGLFIFEKAHKKRPAGL